MLKSFLRVVELRGIQAAGKSTLARSWLQKDSNVVRVNKDDLRTMMFGDFMRRQHEPVVKACEIAIVKTALQAGYSVIVDDTNLPASNHWKEIADEMGVKHLVRNLEVSIDEAIKRDSQRPKPVGPIVIRATAKRL